MRDVKIILVAAPSGGGKSSFVERACADDQRLQDIVTFTTRPIRKGETDGVHYHFCTTEKFESMIGDGSLVEWAKVHGNYYGIGLSILEKAWKAGRCAILDIDVQGVETILRKFPRDTKTVFILPPSIDELRRRIEKRDGGKPKDLEIRMQNAEREMAEAGKFDVQIINDHFHDAYATFKKVVEEWLGPV